MILAAGLGCESLSLRRRNTQPQTKYQTAKQLAAEGELQSALEQLQQVVDAEPQHVGALTAIGDIRRKQGQFQQAAVSYQAACQADPYAFRAHYNLGVTYQTMADLAKTVDTFEDYLRKAIAVYIRAVTIDNGNFDANLNLGCCCYQLGQYELAEQYTRTALSLRPDSVKAHNNLAILCQVQNRLDEAMAEYRASLEVQTDQPAVLMNIGHIYVQQNQLPYALNAFGTAAKLNPADPEPWLQIGVNYFRLKKLDNAVRAFQEAIRRNPKEPKGYRGFGVVCMYQYVVDRDRTDLRDKALQAWRYCLYLQPGQTDLLRLIERFTPQTAMAE
jgi:tetratricopeptide (TPR) repeat protein